MMRYRGQKLIAAVATKMMPIHPHGVLGPMKTRLMRASPKTNLTILSMLPMFAFISLHSMLSCHEPGYAAGWDVYLYSEFIKKCCPVTAPGTTTGCMRL